MRSADDAQMRIMTAVTEYQRSKEYQRKSCIRGSRVRVLRVSAQQRVRAAFAVQE